MAKIKLGKLAKKKTTHAIHIIHPSYIYHSPHEMLYDMSFIIYVICTERILDNNMFYITSTPFLGT